MPSSIETLDVRLADGTDTLAGLLSQNAVLAFANRAFAGNNPAVAPPSAATKTGFAAVKLTARASGQFFVSLKCKYAAVAADVVTTTVDVYTDAVAGTPLTLPANAVQVPTNTNVWVDSLGTGIAPSGGATAAFTITAPDKTATGDVELDFAGIVKGNPNINPGSTFYCVFSVTDSVATHPITQLTVSAFELT